MIAKDKLAVLPDIDIEKYYKKIAKIESTFLGREDHGIFTFVLYLNYGNSSQGAGTYMLDAPSHKWGRVSDSVKYIHPIREGTPWGLALIMETLDACGVDQWEKLKGRTIYALFDSDEWNEPVRGLAPLPTEPGKPVIFEEVFNRYYDVYDELNNKIRRIIGQIT